MKLYQKRYLERTRLLNSGADTYYLSFFIRSGGSWVYQIKHQATEDFMTGSIMLLDQFIKQ